MTKPHASVVVLCTLMLASCLMLAQQNAPNTQGVTPPPGSPTPTPARMTFFVTSVGLGKGGDLGGLAGADAHCQALAAAVGAGGHTWHAYLSTQARPGQPAVNARDRIGTGPWFNCRSRNWERRKTPSFRRTLANFTETRSSRRSAAAIYSSSPHATSMDRSFTASAIRHRFSTKSSRDRSGTAALTWITPTILATTGPAVQQVPRRSAILIESAMAHPGIPRTPPKDAARQRWRAAAARAFSIVSQLTDIHRLAHAFFGRSVSAPCPASVGERRAIGDLLLSNVD